MLYNPELVRKIFDGDKTVTRRVTLPHNLRRHLVKYGWDAYPTQGYDLSFANAILADHPYSECVIPGRGKPAAMWKGDDLQLWAQTWNGPTGKEWRLGMEQRGYQPLRQTYLPGLRYEPLQDITEAEAKAEGVTPFIEPRMMAITLSGFHHGGVLIYRKPFITLWDSINASRGYAWADNGYVWRIPFKREA